MSDGTNKVISTAGGAAIGFFTGLRTGNPVAAVIGAGVGAVAGATGQDVSDTLTKIFTGK